MELELRQETVRGWESVCRATLEQEETAEMIVPDACPDIWQVLDGEARLLLQRKEPQDGKGEFSGLLKTPSFRRAQSEALDRAATWLERIGLLEHANRQASNLAYGDQRRLEIARCMVTQPEILMLDEPAAGLNPKETKELDELIAELRNAHNTTILLIEHDMKLVMGISDRIYVVNQGTPLANGTPEQIRNNPDVIRAYLGEA